MLQYTGRLQSHSSLPGLSAETGKPAGESQGRLVVLKGGMVLKTEPVKAATDPAPHLLAPNFRNVFLLPLPQRRGR